MVPTKVSMGVILVLIHDPSVGSKLIIAYRFPHHSFKLSVYLDIVGLVDDTHLPLPFHNPIPHQDAVHADIGECESDRGLSHLFIQTIINASTDL